MSGETAGRIALELDTYFVLDGRKELHGVVRGLGESDRSMSLSLRGKERPTVVWEYALLPFESEEESDQSFAIPVGDLAPGYYDLTVDGCLPSICVTVALGTRGKSSGRPAAGYLDVVTQAVDAILAQQARRFLDAPDGVPFVTVTRPVTLGYRSLGHRENGVYRTYWFPERPFEYETFRADRELWPILDLLSEATGRPVYRKLVDKMLEIVAEHGFDSRSGLMFLSQECDFDVRTGEAHSKGATDVPKFKPLNSGNCPELCLDRVWPYMPRQLHRCFRAMFYGLITDPENFDYNRFCEYGFDDRAGVHSLVKTPSHCAFDTAGGRMIHWWCSCWRRTGDSDCLDWAQRMADKWEAVQHPESGLIPNFFGAVGYAPGEDQPPGQWVETRGAALTAVSWMQAVEELRQSSGGETLSQQLEQMASRLALGVATFSYDPEARIFREHLELDGRPWQGTARYCFASEAEKAEAVDEAPEMAQVQVYIGAGLYRHPNYYEHCAGTDIPFQLGQAATLMECPPSDLFDRLSAVAGDALDESRKLDGAFTPEGRWTFRATGQYIKLCLLLAKRGVEAGRFLEWARELADRECDALAGVRCPDWWRLRERATFLEALLRLHAAEGVGLGE